MLEDSEVFCFSSKTNPLYTRCTGLNCSDVNCWTPHSACRSTFSGGTLLHCLIGSNYCLTSSTEWCTVGLDPKMELLKKLHNIHLCECSFSIKHQISFRFLLISNVCNKLSTNLFLFHYDVFQVCLGVWEVCQGHDRAMPCTAIQDVCSDTSNQLEWKSQDTRCSCLAVCSPKPPRVWMRRASSFHRVWVQSIYFLCNENVKTCQNNVTTRKVKWWNIFRCTKRLPDSPVGGEHGSDRRWFAVRLELELWYRLLQNVEVQIHWYPLAFFISVKGHFCIGIVQVLLDCLFLL